MKRLIRATSNASSIDYKIKDFLSDWAKKDAQKGRPALSMKDFKEAMKDEELKADQDRYDYYLECYNNACAAQKKVNGNRLVTQRIGDDSKEQVNATTTYMNSNGPSRVNAREILKKYTPDQIALVQKCNDDLNAEISKQFAEDWDPEVGAVNLNSIKTDWLIEAIEDDLLTEEEFEELLSAIDVLDTESANAYA